MGENITIKSTQGHLMSVNSFFVTILCIQIRSSGVTLQRILLVHIIH